MGIERLRRKEHAGLYISRHESRRRQRQRRADRHQQGGTAEPAQAPADHATKMSEKGKEFNLPTFGGGVNAKELAIFTRQFSVMIDAGLPLVQCLEILAGQQENKIFQKVLTGTRGSVEGGATLSAAMREYPKVFDALYVNMVEAGETGGILDTILQRLSTYIEKNVKLQARREVRLVYPVGVLTRGRRRHHSAACGRLCRFSPRCSPAWASILPLAHQDRHRA